MRWVRIISIGLISLVLLTMIVGYLYLVPFDGFENIVLGQVRGALGPDSPVEIEVGDISGWLINAAEIENLSVFYHDSTRFYRMLSVGRITAEYSVFDLMDGRLLFDRLVFDSLDILATKDADGRWLVPLPPVGGGGGDSGTAPILGIDQLEINDARLRAVRAEDDTVAITDLYVSASMQAEEKTYSLELKALDFVSSFGSVGKSEMSGIATFSGGNLVFQDFQVVRGNTRLKLSGSYSVDDTAGAAEVTLDQIDLAEVSAMLGAKLNGLVDLSGTVAYADGKLSGRAHIGGNFLFVSLENLFTEFRFKDKHLYLDTLYGTILGTCGIDGTAEVRFTPPMETYAVRAGVKNFNLNNIVANTFHSDLSGSLTLDGQSFSNKDLLLKFDVDLRESSFDEYPLHHAFGPVHVTTDSLMFPEPFTVDYFENTFTTTGTIDYDEDMLLYVDADLANLDRYRGKLFIDQPGGHGTGAAILSGRTSDPDLNGWFSSDSLWVYGLYADSCYSRFDIDRFLTGQQGEVTVDLLSGAAWQVPYDTGYAHITLDSEIVHIDTVGFNSKVAVLAAGGTLDQGAYPWSLTVDTATLAVLERDFYNHGKMRVLIDTLGFDLKETTMGKGAAMLSADGRVDYDESMLMALKVNDIPLAPWLHLSYPELDADGYLSGQAYVSGDFISPQFSVVGSIDSMVYRGVSLGALSLSARYTEGLVTIDSLLVHAHPGLYRAHGQFYADLAFVAGDRERLPDLPFDISVSATDQRFDLVSLFLPSVEDMSGDFFADFTLSGTPSEPHLDGEAFLRDGELKYFDLANRIQTDSAGVTMKDDMIEMDNITVFVKDKPESYALIDGNLRVKTLDTLFYNLSIHIPHEMPFKYELDDIEGVVKEGNLTVLGDTPPTVLGNLTLSEVRYRAEFTTEEAGSPVMIALSGEDLWDLNINIDIPSRYWIKNQDIDAEFSGFINLIRDNGKYRFIGELEILRGKGFLFDKTFRIEPGSQVTFEDIEYPNPRLDITATTRIPVASTTDIDENSRTDVELAIQVSGTLENPELNTVESDGADNSLSREEILPLIVANYYGSGTPGQFDARVSQLISSQVSQIGTRTLGVETFEIDPTYKGELDPSHTMVTLGLYPFRDLLPNLYLYGGTDVSLEQRRTVGFEYRLGKALLVEGAHNDDIDDEDQELYRVNLKLHWEF